MDPLWKNYVVAISGFGHHEGGILKQLLNIAVGVGRHKIRPPSKVPVFYVHFKSYKAMRTAENALQNQVFLNYRLNVIVEKCDSTDMAEATAGALLAAAKTSGELVKSEFVAEEEEEEAEEEEDDDDKEMEEQDAACEDGNEDEAEEEENGEKPSKRRKKEEENDASKVQEVPKLENPRTKVQKLTERLEETFGEYQEYKDMISQRKLEHDGLICPLEEFKVCPDDTSAFECRFSIGVSEDTGEPAVGFDTGLGLVRDISKEEHHFPDHVVQAARVFEKFVLASEDALANAVIRCKFWHELIIRTNQAQDLMLAVLVFTQQGLNQAELDYLKDFFETGEGRNLQVTSLYVKLSCDSFRYKLVVGSAHLDETIADLKFRLPPRRQLWVGVRGAELLCNTLHELLAPTKESSVLTVAGGIGVLGLSLSKIVADVMCVDTLEAVENTKKHAALNSVTNCRYFGGRPNTIFWKVGRKITHDEIFGVVESSVNNHYASPMVVDGLRRVKQMNRLVLVLEMPSSSMANVLLLSKPAGLESLGNPFFPVKAIPVDTKHFSENYVLLILMERFECSVKIPVQVSKPKSKQKSRQKESNKRQKRQKQTYGGKGRRERSSHDKYRRHSNDKPPSLLGLRMSPPSELYGYATQDYFGASQRQGQSMMSEWRSYERIDQPAGRSLSSWSSRRDSGYPQNSTNSSSRQSDTNYRQELVSYPYTYRPDYNSSSSRQRWL